MGKSLVIVESPAKAKTITKYLGKSYSVKASLGHVRDLPKTRLGIDLKNGFEPKYRVIPEKRELVKELSEAAKKARLVYLAPDPDREGEAIAWHLVKALKVPEEKVKRVTFNEITKKAVTSAFKRPGTLNMDRVRAQQARRILDRLVGYLLSPLLWEKISKGLSAGRVQSVATRLIVEREREIEGFEPKEYWKIETKLETERKEIFIASLSKIDGRKAEIPNESKAKEIVQRLENASARVKKVDRKQRSLSPPPPFITSSLQQVATARLKISARKTMRLAQDMYEGVMLGEDSIALITYMRTDSFRVADEAVNAAREFIGNKYGKEDMPEKPNTFKSKKRAQGAHEAIRPTDVFRTPESLEPFVRGEKGRKKGSHIFTSDHLRLYRLIWERFVASQMIPAMFEVTSVQVEAGGLELRAEGKRLVKEGFLKVSGTDPADVLLPELKEGDPLNILEVRPSQHFTQPPPRYTEGTLVKALERKGIGRPSTYSTIISTIQDRGYVELRERKFYATDLGKLVTDQLVVHFGDIVNEDFTSRMETNLDKVEEGNVDWVSIVSEFYEAFKVDLEKAKREMKDIRHNPEKTNEVCERCGAPMVIKITKKGTFLGCSRYPECSNTRPIDRVNGMELKPVETEHSCPKCGSKLMLIHGRNGKFLGCSNYPECRHTANVDENGNPVEPKVTDEKCDKCGAPMVVKYGKKGAFLACSKYPECKNTKPLKKRKSPPPIETDEKCDKCGAPMVIRQGRWGPFLGCSAFPKCRNIKKLPAKNLEPEKTGKSKE